MYTEAKRIVKKGLRAAVGAFNSAFGVAITPEGYILSTPRNMHPGTYVAILRGGYERAELSLLKQFTAASTIVELGSNIGVVTTAALNKLSTTGRMVCVEPNPDSLPALSRNIQRALERNFAYMNPEVQIIQAAVGKEGSTTQFIRRAGLDSGLVGQVAARADDIPAVVVPVKSLSQILREANIRGPYSLICDIEGGEIPMMYDDAQALGSCTEMVIELHPTSLTGSNIDQQQMLERLESLGFRQQENVANTYLLRREFR